ncbi:MAG: ATPase, T2SS/T4P/T4SS family [Acidobacteriota bacterium]
MIDYINSNRRLHIVTIEDPIEYIHPCKKSIVNQRSVGYHTRSFSRALRAALREDPDVVLVGEMRDLETTQLAITAAETGHLVFGTLMTASAHKTVDRVIDAFPANQQSQVRTMLSESLRAVIYQQLLKRSDGSGRVAALEVLVGTAPLRSLIRESKTYQIPSMMQIGIKDGMIVMDAAIVNLFRSGKISEEEAYRKMENPKIFEQFMAKAKGQ